MTASYATTPRPGYDHRPGACLRGIRELLGLSMGATARRYGIKTTELSDLERGNVLWVEVMAPQVGAGRMDALDMAVNLLSRRSKILGREAPGQGVEHS